MKLDLRICPPRRRETYAQLLRRGLHNTANLPRFCRPDATPLARHWRPRTLLVES